ncbi:MAG TPA: hypothetical protein VHD87_07870 [Acidimicrobiales bacterium]|nr:hypothetical protein [Acidimicrobiales bacterium]
MISFIILLALGGLIIGALGRLAVPGPNPMSVGMTILVGLGGSLVAGLIGGIFDRSFGFILAVICTAGIVYFMQRREVRS